MDKANKVLAAILVGAFVLTTTVMDARAEEKVNQVLETAEVIHQEDTKTIEDLQQELEAVKAQAQDLNDRLYSLQISYNEVEANAKTLEEEIAKRKKPEVSRGEPQTLETRRGVAHRFEATAYGDDGSTMTATGITARPGIIAVDPRVIPLHSTVYVEFDGRPDLNGEYYAADVGGAIKGNIIDVFMYGGWNSFGRRGCTVYY